MQSSAADNLERMLAAGRDGVLLRFGLASEYLKAGDAERAIVHLRRAVEIDPAHSASWKLLGRALTGANRPDEAIAAYDEGIRVARSRGDLQALKEMEVFARRLRRQGTEPT